MPSDDAKFHAALIYLDSQDQQTPLASNPAHARNHIVSAEADIFSGATYDSDDECDPETDGALLDAQGRLHQVWDDSLKNRFLDTIARIFAREDKLHSKHSLVLRDLKKKEKKHEAGGDTAGHVTATVMDCGSSTGEFHVFIAKNRGLDEHDKAFAAKLFGWVNNQKQNPNADGQLFFQQLVQFTQRRLIRATADLLLLKETGTAAGKESAINWVGCRQKVKSYYSRGAEAKDTVSVAKDFDGNPWNDAARVAAIRRAEDKRKVKADSQRPAAADELLRMIQKIDGLFNKCTVYCEWNDYENPATGGRSSRPGADKDRKRLAVLCEIATRADKLRSDLRQQYFSSTGPPRFSEDDGEQASIEAFFTSVARQIDLLSLPVRQMTTLKEVAGANCMERLLYTAVPPTSSHQVIDLEDLRQALEEIPHHASSNKAWIGKLKGFKKHPEDFRPKTHCEMQLLLYCDAKRHPHGTKFHPYIGVSKKTCWACEEMLQRTREPGFHTRGTHGRVMGLWAIPMDPENASKALVNAVVSFRREVFRRRNEAIIRDQMARAREIMADVLDLFQERSNPNAAQELQNLAKEHDECLTWRPNPKELPLEAMSSANLTASVRRNFFGALTLPGQARRQVHVPLERWNEEVLNDISSLARDEMSHDGSHMRRSSSPSPSRPESSRTGPSQTTESSAMEPIASQDAARLRPAVKTFVTRVHQELDQCPPAYTIRPINNDRFAVGFDQYVESWARLPMPPRKPFDDADLAVLDASLAPLTFQHPERLAFRPENYRNYFTRLLAEEIEYHRQEKKRFTRYGDKVVPEPGPVGTVKLRVPELADGSQYSQRGDAVAFRPLDSSAKSPFPLDPGILSGPQWRQVIEIVPSANEGTVSEYTTTIDNIFDTCWLRFRSDFLKTISQDATFIINFPLQGYPYRSMLQALRIIHDWFEEYADMKESSEQTQSFIPPAPWLRSMLFPDLADGMDRISADAGEIRRLYYDDELNEEQKRAVDRICLRNYGQVPFLISGPPGTGKTKTLVEAAMQLLGPHTNEGDDERILVCAPSESAADLIAIRIADQLEKSRSGRSIDLFRLNLPSRGIDSIEHGMSRVLLYCESEHGIFKIPDFKKLMRKRVVVTTCLGASLLVNCRLTNRDIFHLENFCSNAFQRPRRDQIRLHWTALLLDEAPQAIEPIAAIPLAVVAMPVVAGDIEVKPIVIMAGDEHQLSPKTHSKNPDLAESMFVRLFKRPLYAEHEEARIRSRRTTGRSRIPAFANLSLNYRSHAAILAIPSKQKYGDSLEPVAPDSEALIGLPIWKGRGWPVLFVPNLAPDKWNPYEESTLNDEEAQLAVDYVLRALQSSRAAPVLRQQDICVMSPFRKNVVRIREHLRDAHLKDVDCRPCDEFQGLEKRLVVLCTTRSQRKWADCDCDTGRGLFAQPNRLTVCMTRARHGLVVIGNPELLVQDPEWLPYLQFYKRNGLVEGGAAALSMVPDDESLSKLERRLLGMEEV